MPERGQESNESRDYHIERINEEYRHVDSLAHSDAAKEIAIEVAEQQLNDIKPQQG